MRLRRFLGVGLPPSPSLFFGRWAIGYWQLAGTFFLGWSEEDGCFGWADRLDLASSEADGLKDIIHLQWINSRVQLLHFGNDGIKLLFVRRMGKASIKAHSIMMVNSETDSAAVVEGVEHAAVGKVVG